MKAKHFLKLRPRGLGFVDPNMSEPLYDKEKQKIITDANIDFQSKIVPQNGKNASRQMSINKHFICKAAFILLCDEDNTLDTCLYELLSDERTLFSLDYQIYQTDHLVYYKDRKEQLSANYCQTTALLGVSGIKKRKFAKALDILENSKVAEYPLENLKEVLIKKVFPEGAPEGWYELFDEIEQTPSFEKVFLKAQKDIGFSKTESQYLRSKEPLEIKRRRQEEVMCFTGDKMTPKVYEALKSIYEKVNLPKRYRHEFISTVLWRFLNCKIDVANVRQETKHYNKTYSQGDWMYYTEYEKHLAKLQQLMAEHASWEMETTDDKVKEYKEKGIMPSEKSEKEAEKSIIRAVRTETVAFLQNMRSNVKSEKEITLYTAQWVMEALNYAQGDFAFRFLVMCISEKKTIFMRVDSADGTDERTADLSNLISKEGISAVLEQPYTKGHPPKQAQRLWCIRFLNNLMDILNVGVAERIENWKLFFKVFGSEILSEEEMQLWKNIIKCDVGSKAGSNKCIIPAIELSLYVADRIKACCPIEYERLYCYTGGSRLHLGGYAEFVSLRAEAIQNCFSSIQKPRKITASRWEKIKKDYLNQWAAVASDYEKIKKICSNGCKLVRTATLGEAYEDFVTHHCDKKMEKELKMLIVETSIRMALAEDAAEKLRDRVKRCFSAAKPFAIPVYPLGGNTPE